MRTTSLLLVAASSAALCCAQTSPAKHLPTHKAKTQADTAKSADAPDIVFFNGTIYTGEGFAQDKPQIVQAIAIRGARVSAVGTTDEITRLAGPKTVLRDLNSANTSTFIFPGFNDAHTHLGGAGRTKLNVDLTGTKSLSAMLSKIEAAAKTAPAGHWLSRGGCGRCGACRGRPESGRRSPVGRR